MYKGFLNQNKEMIYCFFITYFTKRMMTNNSRYSVFGAARVSSVTQECRLAASCPL